MLSSWLCFAVPVVTLPICPVPLFPFQNAVVIRDVMLLHQNSINLSQTAHLINASNLLPPLLHRPRRHIRATLCAPHTRITLLTLAIITAFPPIHTAQIPLYPRILQPRSTVNIARPTASDMIHRRSMSVLRKLPLKFLVEAEDRTLRGRVMDIPRAAATSHEDAGL